MTTRRSETSLRDAGNAQDVTQWLKILMKPAAPAVRLVRRNRQSLLESAPVLPVTQGVERSRYAESMSGVSGEVVVGIMADL
jgi:hypothetical protein